MEVNSCLIVCKLEAGDKPRFVDGQLTILNDAANLGDTRPFDNLCDIIDTNGLVEKISDDDNCMSINEENGVSLCHSVTFSEGEDAERYIQQHVFFLTGPDSDILEALGSKLMIYCQAAGYRIKTLKSDCFEVSETATVEK